MGLISFTIIPTGFTWQKLWYIYIYIMQSLKKRVSTVRTGLFLGRYQLESGSNSCLSPIVLDPLKYPQWLYSSYLYQLTVYPHVIWHIFWYTLSDILSGIVSDILTIWHFLWHSNIFSGVVTWRVGKGSMGCWDASPLASLNPKNIGWYSKKSC